MLDKVKIKKLNKKVDERGWFLKIFDGKEEYREKLIGDVYFVCSQDGGIRGNHYHRNTNEWFSVIKGECELHLVDIDTNKKQIIEMQEENPIVIYVPTNIAHAFYSKTNTEFIVVAFTDVIFKPNDTIKYDII